MGYFYQVTIDIFCILSVSLFLNHTFKIKLHYCFLISLCSSAIIFYSAYLLIPLSLLKYFFYLYLIIIFFIPWKIILENKISKNDKNLLLEFFIISFIISFFCWNKYYLDEDELHYWGKIVKYFHIVKNANSADFPFIYLYHKPFLPLLHFFNSFFTFFREDLSIFSNNTIIIAAFYFVYYNEKINILKRLFVFIIFYICINNLSFGFVSIYADPIIGIIYFSLIFYIYKSQQNLIRNVDFFIILILGLFLFLSHRSGMIYFIFASLFWILLNYRLVDRKKFFFAIVVLFLACFYIFNNIITIDHAFNNLRLSSFPSFVVEFLFIDIYFSDFGVSYNSILSFLGINNFKFPVFDIRILFWFVLIILLTVLNFNKNYKVIIFVILQFFLYLMIIYILKIQIENLHIRGTSRYLGVFFLSILLFNIYFISLKKPTYVLFILFLAMVSITPKKTFGFLLPESLYLKDQSNLAYKKNRDKIAYVAKLFDKQKKIIIIQSNETLNSHLHNSSLVQSAMQLGFYGTNLSAPKDVPQEHMFKTIEYNLYLKATSNYDNYNKVFYNLSELEMHSIKRLPKFNRKKSFFIKFD